MSGAEHWSSSDASKGKPDGRAEPPSSASDRFVGKSDPTEDLLKVETVGLVRLEDFQRKRDELAEEQRRQAARCDKAKCV